MFGTKEPNKHFLRKARFALMLYRRPLLEPGGLTRLNAANPQMHRLSYPTEPRKLQREDAISFPFSGMVLALGMFRLPAFSVLIDGALVFV